MTLPPSRTLPPLEQPLRDRLAELMDEGRALYERFDAEIRQREFHPFIPADYEQVLDALLQLRGPGMRFLEWGSATGVITIMADLLGYDAAGIEIDGRLVATARELAARFESGARFVEGSFLPQGYAWRSSCGDVRLGTIEHGASGYLKLGRPLEEFDVVYGYPWSGEDAMMRDLMRRYGGPGAILLLNSGSAGLALHRNPGAVGAAGETRHSGGR